MPTAGENPGWIFGHQADLEASGVIKIWGGEVIEANANKRRYCRSLDDYTLDTGSWTWVRTVKRNWRQFSICQETGGLFVLDSHPKLEALSPRNIGYVRASGEEWNGARITVVYEARETVWAFRGAEDRRVASLEGGADVA